MEWKCTKKAVSEVRAKALQLGNNMENWEKYQSTRREIKKAVSKARSNAFEGFYQALEIRNGEQKIYKIAKRREKITRDLDQVKCIKDEKGNILVIDGDIKER